MVGSTKSLYTTFSDLGRGKPEEMAEEKLNATAACVLGLLQLGPPPWAENGGAPGAMTGWQLYEAAVDSLSRFWNITRSQIYLELARLAEAGLVEDSGEGGPRERRPYRITDAGRRAFADWLAAWAADEPRDEQLRSPLVLTVFFGEFLPRESLSRMLREYQLRHQRRLDRLRAFGERLRDDHSPPTATVRRGIAYHEMMVRWIDTVLADLAQL